MSGILFSNCFYILYFVLLLGSSWEECLGLYVEKVQVGVVRKDIVEKLVQFPDIFEVVKADSEGNEKPPGVYLSQYLLLPEDRTKALDHVMRVLRQQDELVALRGWRDEVWFCQNSKDRYKIY